MNQRREEIDRVLQKWIDERHAAPSTAAVYRREVSRWLDWVEARGVDLEADCPSDCLQRYLEELQQTHSGATVSTAGSAIRKWLSWRGYPISVHVPRPQRKMGTLTRPQANRALAAASSQRDRAILTLMARCGVGTGALAAATVGDLGTRDGRPTFTVGSRVFAIPDDVDAIVRDYLSTRPTATDSDPLFAASSNGRQGGPISDRSIRAIARGALLAAGMVGERWTARALQGALQDGERG